MKKGKVKYDWRRMVSSVAMILALLWLTVSLPVVYESQQKCNTEEIKADNPFSSNDDDTNPYGNSTEEKVPGNGMSSLNEEYLHDHHASEHFFAEVSGFHNCENAGTYTAFHGELLVPPPNVA